MAQPDGPAVAAHLRRPIAVMASTSALLVAALAIAVSNTRGPNMVDRSARAALQEARPRADVIAYVLDGLSAPVPAVSIVAGLVLGCLLAKMWRLAIVAAIAPLSAAGATVMIKPLVMRTIHGENLAFPSGHTAFATGVGLLLGLLLLAALRPGRAVSYALLAGSAVLVGGLMALSQIVIDAHYATDTIGGFFTACAVVLGTALLTDLPQRIPRTGPHQLHGQN